MQLNNSVTRNKTLLKSFLKGNTHWNIFTAILSYSSQSSYNNAKEVVTFSYIKSANGTTLNFNIMPNHTLVFKLQWRCACVPSSSCCKFTQQWTAGNTAKQTLLLHTSYVIYFLIKKLAANVDTTYSKHPSIHNPVSYFLCSGLMQK
jgi:hypothetical protein